MPWWLAGMPPKTDKSKRQVCRSALHLHVAACGWWHWPACPLDSSGWWQQAQYLLSTRTKERRSPQVHWSSFDKEQTWGAHLWEYPFRTRLPGVWYYIQAIWDRESSWRETCHRKWDFPWTSWSVQKSEFVKRPGHCSRWEGHDHRTEREAEWPPWYHEVSALPRAGHHQKEGYPP